MKIKIIFLFVMLEVFISCTENTVNEPEIIPEDEKIDITQVLNQVNIDSIGSTIKVLSGLEPFDYNNKAVFIKSRNANEAGNNLAAEFIEDKLKSYNINVANQYFNMAGRNVLGSKAGYKYPSEYYIICAHYDSMPYDSIAPGADDNASGSSAVIEAARILSNYNSKYSVIFALWDEEELGLLGSRHYSEQALNENRNIKGVINLDMIGWDSDNNSSMRLIIQEVGLNAELANTVINCNSNYNIGLNIIIHPHRMGSDYVAFWEKGYNAIGIIEDYDDFNANYHTQDDTYNNLNKVFLLQCSKLAISSLTTLAF